MAPKKRKRHTHAQRRAAERYGIVLTEEELKKIVKKIDSGQAGLVHRESSRIQILDVECGSKLVRVVYDLRRKALVTVLPRR